MYYLVTYLNAYNVYCDVTDNTTGAYYTLNKCINSIQSISSTPDWESFEQFEKTYTPKILTTFDSVSSLKQEHPEYFI